MVESNCDKRQSLLTYMQTARTKFEEFSHAMLDVEFNSRDEWKSNLEFQTSQKY